MKTDTYIEILRRLESPEDVGRLSSEFSVPEAVLEEILTQKIVENTRINFLSLTSKEKELLEDWQSGKSILEMSEELGFMPVLVARELLKALGLSKFAVKQKIKNPETIEDERLRREVKEALSEDFVFSPEAHELQEEKSRLGEKIIERWLISSGAIFMTNSEYIRVGNILTPDFLTSELEILGFKINWIESKALFGSAEEHKRYLKKQYSKYIRSFGTGAVVYWYGYEDRIIGEEKNLLVLDYTFFRKEDVEMLFNLRLRK